jgi:hypothetical protein
MAKDDVPESGQAVDELFPVGVGQNGPFPAEPHVTRLVSRGVVERMNQMRTVPREKVGSWGR